MTAWLAREQGMADVFWLAWSCLGAGLVVGAWAGFVAQAVLQSYRKDRMDPGGKK